MTDTTLFLTGFPGFLGSALLPQLLRRTPHSAVVALVQPAHMTTAARRMQHLAAEHPGWLRRVRLVSGDLAQPDLVSLLTPAERSGLTEIYHFAAVYDLRVPREVGMAVNVQGTRHVLRLAHAVPRVPHLHYVSTCYVSGRHDGWYRESDLDVGQSFNNYYEETKFLAEVAVHDAMRGGLPTTIYRPAIVVGDSRTGATQKYDGPYYMLRWMLRWPGLAPVPVLGDPAQVRLNLVPRDYVTRAIDVLSQQPCSRGKVYHLSDPRPCSIADVLALFSAATGRAVLRIPVPETLTRRLARRFRPVVEALGFPPEVLDYFVHPTHYDCTEARQALAQTGVTCPPLSTYVERLVGYMKAHPQVTSAAMT